MRCALVFPSAAALAALASCSPGPPLQRSCEGRAVDTCDPYEYAEVAAVSFEPMELSPGDPRQSARVRIELRTCGARTPSAPAVQIAAVVAGAGGVLPFDAAGADAGGGDDTRLYQLAEVRASDAGATTIEATLPNPFDARVPARTDIRLRFTPVLGGCEGGALSIPYRTGNRPSP
ncbi:MAG: hypothetical protein ACK6CU_07355 [Deltaproteobacteria bacterium]|jgi:hypothetical protein